MASIQLALLRVSFGGGYHSTVNSSKQQLEPSALVLNRLRLLLRTLLSIRAVKTLHLFLMAKDDKKKKAEKKARAAQKQEKKTTKTEKKQSKKAKDDDSDAEDADLDAILAAYQKQQEQFLKVTEVVCDPPTPRKLSI